jgi:fucose permease
MGSGLVDPGRRWGLVTCHVSMLTVAIALNLMPILLPILRTSVGPGVPLTNEQLGRIAAMTFVGMTTGLLVSAPLANRYSARWFTMGGNLILLAGLLFLGAAESYAGVLAAATLMGVGGGVLDMILSPIVCALVPDRRGQAMNWLHSLFCVGAFLVVLVASVAFGRSWSWHRVAFLMAIAPGAVALAFGFVPHPNLAPATSRRVRVRDLARDPYFLLCLATIFLGGAVEMGIVQWLPAYAELELGLSRWMGGSSLLAFSVAMAFGRIGAGVASGRIPVRRVMTACTAAAAVLILVGGLAPFPGFSLANLVLGGVALGCLWPSTLGLAADRFPSAGASMFGVLSAVGNLGGVVMPWAVGIIGDFSRIGAGIAASAICPILILLALRAMGRMPVLSADRAVA